ncbi:MAG: CbiX/SirB N-terminal domain-containing protein [Gammaproteobacteria bacterium]|nr:CbiX/SirB N-terminal domain-containing protein [Gammaproteobacteria bacterium]MCW8923848.1 CbiX/SirB N-terminal domain-containing protein [Gammaproteobacteria bacterium]
MNALLLVAHGSRRQQSNEEVRLLADKLKSRCGESFPIIHAGFLELAEPLIPDGLQKCIDDGASRVTVLPYFLNTGRHVAEDIPDIIDEFKRNSSVEINLTSHLGASEMMLDVLASVASE